MSNNNNNKREIFRIPSPDKTDSGYKFHTIVRIGRIVPFGYMQDPNDPEVLLPIEEELLLLEAAKEHLKNYSLRDVAAWISQKSGRSISHVGLYKRIKAEQIRAKEYLDSKRLAKKFRDVYHKARRLEEGRLGKRDPLEHEIDDELYQTLDKTIKG